MRTVSEETKIAQHRGLGTKADYSPWIQVGEFGSNGTAVIAVDWKTGRTVHLLSQAEAMVWYSLRWNDENVDIREQYPLCKQDTMRIAARYGLLHPSTKDGKPVVMTTDFLVDKVDRQIAVSVKCDWDTACSREINHAHIERMYWEEKKVGFQPVSKKNMNPNVYNNLRVVTAFYNATVFPDAIAVLKHLIARKRIEVDLTQPLNFRQLLNEYREPVGQFLLDNKNKKIESPR